MLSSRKRSSRSASIVSVLRKLIPDEFDLEVPRAGAAGYPPADAPKVPPADAPKPKLLQFQLTPGQRITAKIYIYIYRRKP